MCNDFLFLISGPLVSIGGRDLSDPRSCLQIGRIYCLLLHSAWGYAAHILPHCPFVGSATTEFGRIRHGNARKLGQWLAWPGTLAAAYVNRHCVQIITHPSESISF